MATDPLSEELLNDLGEHFAQACRRGECPTIRDYTSKFPSQHAEELKEFLESIAILEDLKRGRESGAQPKLMIGGCSLQRRHAGIANEVAHGFSRNVRAATFSLWLLSSCFRGRTRNCELEHGAMSNRRDATAWWILRSGGGILISIDNLCRTTGEWHDPCVIDVFIAAVRFMAGEPSRPWWKYTPERKRALADKKQ